VLKRDREKKAAKQQDKEARRTQAALDKQAAETEKRRREFYATPAGQARIAFQRGDHVFQYAIDVMSQKAIIVAMVGSSTSKSTHDPTVVLNSVCHEGWELVGGSFVFVQTGQQSRDKFMSSGQNVAVAGTTVGYYLFKRSEANRRDVGDPWLQPIE
jgi:hypothetical protein